MAEDGVGLLRRDHHPPAAVTLLAQAHLDIRIEACQHLMRIVYVAVGPAQRSQQQAVVASQPDIASPTLRCLVVHAALLRVAGRVDIPAKPIMLQ
ncbi:hypothetical protein D3C80_1976700 [compost metagenome]